MTKNLYQHQLPLGYKISKDLNDHFYKKYIGYDIDIKFSKWQISMIERKIHQNKCRTLDINDFYGHSFNTSSTSFHKKIQEQKKDIEVNIFLRKHFLKHYQQSTQQLDNYNIIEL